MTLKNEAMKTLYEEIVLAGIPTDHHESDLYVLDTALSRELIAKNGKVATGFVSRIDGKRWLDIPFAFDPFWKARNQG